MIQVATGDDETIARAWGRFLQRYPWSWYGHLTFRHSPAVERAQGQREDCQGDRIGHEVGEHLREQQLNEIDGRGHCQKRQQPQADVPGKLLRDEAEIDSRRPRALSDPDDREYGNAQAHDEPRCHFERRPLNIECWIGLPEVAPGEQERDQDDRPRTRAEPS